MSENICPYPDGFVAVFASAHRLGEPRAIGGGQQRADIILIQCARWCKVLDVPTTVQDVIDATEGEDGVVPGSVSYEIREPQFFAMREIGWSGARTATGRRGEWRLVAFVRSGRRDTIIASPVTGKPLVLCGSPSSFSWHEIGVIE